MPDALIVTWEALDGLVARLASEVGREHDLVLAITRGGLVPAGMLAYRLNLREILVAGVAQPLLMPNGHKALVITDGNYASLLNS